eukprot:s3220_g3.t1
MDEVGEFIFQVNETCLHNDSEMFLLYPNDKDSHNPFLVNLTPFDVTHNEARQFIPPETKMKRKKTRKEIQRTNRRKKYDNTWEEEEQDDEGPWLNKVILTGPQLDNSGKTGHGVMITLTGGINDVINALEKVKVPNNLVLVVVEKVGTRASTQPFRHLQMMLIEATRPRRRIGPIPERNGSKESAGHGT